MGWGLDVRWVLVELGRGVGVGELGLRERKKVGWGGLERNVVLLGMGSRVGRGGMELLWGVEKLSDWRMTGYVGWLFSPGVLTNVYASHSLSKASKG